MAGQAEVLILCMAIVPCTIPLVADGLLLGLLCAPRVASSCRCSRMAGHAEVLFLSMATVQYTTPLVVEGLLLGLLHAPRVVFSGAAG